MKGITLFIFGGVAEMGEEPPSPKAEFTMAAVGPLSSIVIGLVFYAVFWAAKDSGLPESIKGIVGYLAFINLMLAAFNLLPAFPLDGGRVLRSILWAVKGNLDRATSIASNVGSGFGIFFVVLGVINVLTGNFIGGMWWFLIGLFLRNAAKASYQKLVTRKALEGESLERFVKRDPVTVSPSTSVAHLVEDFVYEHHFKMFPVVDNGNRLLGCVSTKQVKEIPREAWGEKTVADITQPCSEENTVSENTDPMEVLEKMNKTGSSRLMVVKGERLVGIIALKDMLQFLSLKIELGE
jgi:CBS domain-containing protein